MTLVHFFCDACNGKYNYSESTDKNSEINPDMIKKK